MQRALWWMEAHHLISLHMSEDWRILKDQEHWIENHNKEAGNVLGEAYDACLHIWSPASSR